MGPLKVSRIAERLAGIGHGSVVNVELRGKAPCTVVSLNIRCTSLPRVAKTDCYDYEVNFSIALPTELAKQQCDYRVHNRKSI